MFSIFAKKPRPQPDQKLVVRGQHAINLLKDEMFHECMESLEKDIWQQFMATPADDKDAREVLYVHITALKNIKERLELYASQGKMAEHKLKEKNK